MVEFYNGGGIMNPFLDNTIIPLELTEQEKGDLVALLRSLNGEGWQQVEGAKDVSTVSDAARTAAARDLLSCGPPNF